MNKKDTAIVVVLFLILLGWMWHQNKLTAERARLAQEKFAAQQAAEAEAAVKLPVETGLEAATTVSPTPQSQPTGEIFAPPSSAAPQLPEKIITLESDALCLNVSSHGGTITSVTLPQYRTLPAEDSPPVVLEYQSSPMLALTGLPGLAANADYADSRKENSIILKAASSLGFDIERRITLTNDCRVVVTDTFRNATDHPITFTTNWLGMGVVERLPTKNATAGVDSYATGIKVKVQHWESRLAGMLTGGKGGMGCGGRARTPIHKSITKEVDGPQEWVALKSRFFVQSFTTSVTNAGFRANAFAAEMPRYSPVSHISGEIAFAGFDLLPGTEQSRTYSLYIGPKKLKALQELGNRQNEIMEFGFFRWFCELLVPTLNFFYKLIPNYGVAIMLLTLMVRLLFWPLTHKGTEGMKRMQALQPKLAALKAQFKDDPQKMQQETWKLYRENKVNPMASCLPTLIQIPVFIALYTVLRSAIELRFAPFLWITDLSEPENLLAGILPNGYVLNILPIMMAATMALQSYFTPSMGDAAQQKMMMWLMPCMLLFMFYGLPSALTLYWTFSQGIAIGQLWWQRRRAAHATALDGPDSGDTINMTRQMRRRTERERQ